MPTRRLYLRSFRKPGTRLWVICVGIALGYLARGIWPPATTPQQDPGDKPPPLTEPLIPGPTHALDTATDDQPAP